MDIKQAGLNCCGRLGLGGIGVTMQWKAKDGTVVRSLYESVVRNALIDAGVDLECESAKAVLDDAATPPPGLRLFERPKKAP